MQNQNQVMFCVAINVCVEIISVNRDMFSGLKFSFFKLQYQLTLN